MQGSVLAAGTHKWLRPSPGPESLQGRHLGLKQRLSGNLRLFQVHAYLLGFLLCPSPKFQENT